VLAHRIVHLLDELPQQSSIIALTFSNKAQQEMKSRVDELNPDNVRAVKIHTFHSFCSRVLRTYGRDVLGDLVQNLSFASNFSTFDQSESLRLVKNILKRNQLNHLKEDDVFNQITKSKEGIVLNWTNQDSKFTLSSNRVDRMLYDSYERDLRESNAADFCDLLVLTWRLLREYPVIRADLQKDYQHILIDEYQDTNLLQYEITKLLYQPPAKESLVHRPDLSVPTPRSLFVVGDANQSIYSWRGALPENLNRLSNDFPNCLRYDLKVNYRSSPNILAVANAVLGNISTTPPVEKLELDHLPVYVYSAKDDLTQAEFICRSLKSMTGKSRAILYRTNAQSHALEVHFSSDSSHSICRWLSCRQESNIKSVAGGNISIVRRFKIFLRISA
jgi:DNA helicase II / ATP-dependent DNA helicase PcrA